MSSRKPSSFFLIRALARTGKGILLIGPEEKKDSHYLPWERNPKNIEFNCSDLQEPIKTMINLYFFYIG